MNNDIDHFMLIVSKYFIDRRHFITASPAGYRHIQTVN